MKGEVRKRTSQKSGTSPVTRNGVGATPAAVNLLGGNRTLITKRVARLLSADRRASP